MLLTQQLHMMTDLVQSVMGALETDNPELAKQDVRKLARLIAELNRSFFLRMHEEMRHVPPAE